MKYKVGDKVRIKNIDWYNQNKINGIVVIGENAFNEDMSNYCGQIMTISDIELDYYLLKGTQYAWTDDMIEELVEDISKKDFRRKIREKEKYFFENNPCRGCGPGNGCDDCRGCESNKIKGQMLGEIRKLKEEYNNIFNEEYVYLKKNKKSNNIQTSNIQSNFMQLGKITSVIFNEQNHQDKVELELGDYELKQEGDKWFAVKKKPKYPTTYEECCEILKVDTEHTLEGVPLISYNVCVLEALQKILICRDAYWKIINDWQPNWNNSEEIKYVIFFDGDILEKGKYSTTRRILAFPSREMRDIFYENFKDLIEECKELL